MSADELNDHHDAGPVVDELLLAYGERAAPEPRSAVTTFQTVVAPQPRADATTFQDAAALAPPEPEPIAMSNQPVQDSLDIDRRWHAFERAVAAPPPRPRWHAFARATRG